MYLPEQRTQKSLTRDGSEHFHFTWSLTVAGGHKVLQSDSSQFRQEKPFLVLPRKHHTEGCTRCAYVCGEITKSWIPEEQELPVFVSLCFHLPTSWPALNPELKRKKTRLCKVSGAHGEVKSHGLGRNPGSKQGKSRKKLWKDMSPPAHHPACETVHKTNVFAHRSDFIPVYYI